MNDCLAEIRNKMIEQGISKLAIENFIYNYNLYNSGNSSFISAQNIKNPNNIEFLSDIEDSYIAIGQTRFKNSVIIKLNGGLGTSMGLKKAKSLLTVKNGFSFLDIIAKQAELMGIPLILMDSFNTRGDSLELLSKYEKIKNQKLPLDFIQNKVPKISLNTEMPVIYKDDENLEWCPPGHGDIYISLVINGVLDQLLADGIEYAFISNADNLGATLDLRLLGYFVDKKIPFLMEVAERTESDKKGGHLAVNNDGQFILREIAQCPVEEIDDFQDFTKYTFFNTNNIWINLKALKSKMEESNYNLKLPMIVNEKNVNPRDEGSEKVVQLETAMGSAIEVFENSAAICVPRTRFVPVKKTNDLMKIQSDLYELDEKCNLIARDYEVASRIVIDLDEKQYKNVDEFHNSFCNANIGLLQCDKLFIKGKVVLKGDVNFIGEVEIDV